jgi:hypothetical protein
LRNSTVAETSPASASGESIFARFRLNSDSGKDRKPGEEWETEDPMASGYDGSNEPHEETGLLTGNSTQSGHGTLAPRRLLIKPGLHRNYDSFTSYMTDQGFGGAYPGDGDGEGDTETDVEAEREGDESSSSLLADILPSRLAGENGKRMTTTRYLRKKYGIRGKRLM